MLWSAESSIHSSMDTLSDLLCNATSLPYTTERTIDGGISEVPWWARESLFGCRGLTVIFTTVCLWLVDRGVLMPLELQGRYFILHAAGNTIAVVLTFEGMVRTLMDPVHAADGDTSIFGYCVVVGIHLYHILAFRPLPQIEWIHHILMIGVVGPVTFYYARGAIIDYCSFFLSGLPGGIDYCMLALVKNGVVEKQTEKRVNSAINTWMRTPFGVIGAYILFQVALYKHETLTTGEVVSMLTVAGLVLWNALYFGRRVVENYGGVRGPGAEPRVS